MRFRYFNPRSREGSDDQRYDSTSYEGDFNPRSREGSDLIDDYPDESGIYISIHAPVKGATRHDFVHGSP